MDSIAALSVGIPARDMECVILYIGKSSLNAPYGKAIINSVVYSLKYMREVVYDYKEHPEKILEIPGIGITTIDDALEILKDYWIFLEYNNVKRDGNNVEGALETPINVELRKAGITPFSTRKMTGDETFQDVREVLSQVETNEDVFNGANLIVATSMISHGVDADRFNIMFFYGMPGNTAEYIQAYSRTARRHSSIYESRIRVERRRTAPCTQGRKARTKKHIRDKLEYGRCPF